MKVLAIDTSGAACSVGVCDVGSGEAVVQSRAVERGHAEVLMPMLAEAMAAACLRFEALDLIAVAVGPGSFTGLRVGIAAARALALAARRPCVGVPTLAAVAASCRGLSLADPAGTLVVCLDSRRADIFAQAFASTGAALTTAAALAPAALAAVVPAGPLAVAGDAAEVAAVALRAAGRCVQVLPVRATCPLALARFAASAWQISPSSLLPPQPLYLREPDIGASTAPAAAAGPA